MSPGTRERERGDATRRRRGARDNLTPVREDMVRRRENERRRRRTECGPLSGRSRRRIRFERDQNAGDGGGGRESGRSHLFHRFNMESEEVRRLHLCLGL